jgi:hypothetical protein
MEMNTTSHEYIAVPRHCVLKNTMPFIFNLPLLQYLRIVSESSDPSYQSRVRISVWRLHA